jgi:hypothetical protein
MVLYALPFAGAGLAWTLTWMTGRWRAQRWLPAAGLAALVAMPVGWLATRGVDRGVGVRPAAAWIRTQVAGTPVIVTNIAKLTYHAGAERVELSGTYEEILNRGRARSAHFIAFYPDLLPNVSPDFLTRLNAGDPGLIQTFLEPSRRSPDQRLEIYRLRIPEGRRNPSLGARPRQDGSVSGAPRSPSGGRGTATGGNSLNFLVIWASFARDGV